MDDLINRAMAIEAVENALLAWSSMSSWREAKIVEAVADLPSAQPERKTGKWIAVTEDGDVYKRICSCCGKEAFFQNDDPDELYDGGRYKLSDFCPHCGARMEVDDGSD